MSERKPNQRRHQKKPVQQLSPEQIAALEKAQADALEAFKAEQERLRLWGAAVEKMTHRQLKGELRRAVKREYAGRPPQPQAGLTIALATVLSTMLSNTNTPENPWGKLSSYPR